MTTASIAEIYLQTKRRGARQFRWRIRDKRNRRIIGASSESYLNRHQVIKNLKRVTGIKYVPPMEYGQKKISFWFWRDVDGTVIYGGVI